LEKEDSQSPKPARERPREVALLRDPHWRTTVNSALRVSAWRSATTPAPATILRPALEHIQRIDVRDFQRLANRFNFSNNEKRGGVRVSDGDASLGFKIAARLEKDPRRDPAIGISLRSVVIVALYAYALELLKDSQVRLFRRMVEFLARELKDQTARSRAMEVTKTTKQGLDRLLAAANNPPPLGQPEADQSFMKLSQIMDAIGVSTATVFHAAAVAATDEDFFNMVEQTMGQPAKGQA
jgi:hypothetical protein